MLKHSEAIKIKPGTILYNSWGYDQTQNDFCKVLNNTGKTIKCIMIQKESLGENGFMSEEVKPNPSKETGTPFRLRITKWKPSINDPKGLYASLNGKYPYCQNNKHSGSFSIFTSKTLTDTHYA